MDDRGIEGLISGRGTRFESSPGLPNRLWSLSSPLSNWYRGPFPERQRVESETGHSFPSSVEFQYSWSYVYVSSLPHIFMACTRTTFIIDMHDASRFGSSPDFRLFVVVILRGYLFSVYFIVSGGGWYHTRNRLNTRLIS
jgi:hypothetical protein